MVRVPLIFASLFRPHRLAWPRTLPFQGSNTGSNPVGDTSEAPYAALPSTIAPSFLEGSALTAMVWHGFGLVSRPATELTLAWRRPGST
jgi:hypothetical protein